MLKIFFPVRLILLIFSYQVIDQGRDQMAIARLPDQQLLETVVMEENMFQLLQPGSDPFTILFRFTFSKKNF